MTAVEQLVGLEGREREAIANFQTPIVDSKSAARSTLTLGAFEADEKTDCLLSRWRTDCGCCSWVLWGVGLIFQNIFDFDFGGGSETVTVLDKLASPDGECVATTYSAMGGGAAGWCFKRVTINKKLAPFSWDKEKERGGYSFDVRCHSNIELKWESNRELVIAYTGSDNQTGIRISQMPTSEDHAVKIKYVAK